MKKENTCTYQCPIQTRPFRRAIKWAELLAQEFACQGDLERQLGMPVQPMNDRDKMVLEDMQIGFIRFVAMNLFQSVADVTHGMYIYICTMTMKYLSGCG